MDNRPKERRTEAEVRAWEARMEEAGIEVTTSGPSTVTLLKRREPVEDDSEK